MARQQYLIEWEDVERMWRNHKVTGVKPWRRTEPLIQLPDGTKKSSWHCTDDELRQVWEMLPTEIGFGQSWNGMDYWTFVKYSSTLETAACHRRLLLPGCEPERPYIELDYEPEDEGDDADNWGWIEEDDDEGY